MTTREAWLLEAVRHMRPMFKGVGLKIPKTLRVSVGFPLGRRTIIGQCWSSASAEDGVNQIFISPVHTDAVKVLGTLVHELIHASLNNEDGHKGRFATAARALGLSGKLTATTVGEDLEPRLRGLAEHLGPWNHAPLNAAATASGPKPQKNRHLKIVCVDTDCGYTVRTTQKWIERGTPTCPCGDDMRTDE